MLSAFACALLALAPLAAADDSPWPSAPNQSAANSTLATNASASSNNWNPSAVNNPGTNARIPSSASPGCQAFLARLNSNSKIKSCTGPLMNATAAFSAGPQAVGPDQLKSAFASLCGASSGPGCGMELMHDVLNHFSGNCSDELSAGLPAIQAAYDVLYIMLPLKRALCSQDPNTGDYCPTFVASAVINATTDAQNTGMSASDFRTMVSNLLPSGKLVSQLGNSISKRSIAAFNTAPASAHHSHQRRGHSGLPHSAHLLHRQLGANSTTYTNASITSSNGSFTSSNATDNIYHPDPATYTSTNLAFLFLSPSLPKSALCTPCTVSVLASYIAFEQSVPHFGGLAASGYLSGQVRLWKGISGKCGTAFTNSISTRAGIVSMQTTSDASSNTGLHSIFISLIASLVLGLGLVVL